MSSDLTSILKDWPFEAGKPNVRVIVGDDGDPRLQVRLDLGILQMFTEGRPDGQRPHGFPSLLEYHEARLDDRDKDDEPFDLSPDDCRDLREEAVQYYHRYMALLAVEDYEGVIRDTSRNLRLLDFCAAHAKAEGDRAALEQYRPFITLMRARAAAAFALADDEPKAAILAVDEAIDALRAHFAAAGRDEQFESSSEVQALRGMRDALVPKLPVSQKAELRARLAQAIEQENYKLAAILRDELKLLRE